LEFQAAAAAAAGGDTAEQRGDIAAT